jgi:hypothetical protein
MAACGRKIPEGAQSTGDASIEERHARHKLGAARHRENTRAHAAWGDNLVGPCGRPVAASTGEFAAG